MGGCTASVVAVVTALGHPGAGGKPANKTEAEVRRAELRPDWFDFGEALLEIGLAIASITPLTRHRVSWFLGRVSARQVWLRTAAGFLLRRSQPGSRTRP